MPENFKISIMKHDPSLNEKPAKKTYEVPDDPEFAPMTALKALHYINRYLEPVAYDYNCRRGTCGRCAMMIDGQPRLACLFPLSGSHTLEPLFGFPVVRDLVVDKGEAYARFVNSNHSIKTLGPKQVLKPIPFKHWEEKIYPLNSCRECMSCYASCQSWHLFNRKGSYAGPGAMQQIYLRHIDTEDKMDRIEQAVFSGLFECVQCGTCTQVCPALIPGSENIKAMMDEAEARGLKPASGQATDYWPAL
ncbi:MAG: 4Fe-4S dicluster domain-containing protein [Coriobacteriaceae bacterium]|jgi:succinate dehydrogenase/fumarate reductase iron-sulfur protein|nr:4Fe-4S dicluster domain-containing protein [Coriobacteriaceae bacterium]